MDLLIGISGLVSPQDQASQMREMGNGQGETLSIDIFILK